VKPQVKPPLRKKAAIALIAVAALGAAAYGIRLARRPPLIEVPNPDTSAMEAEVAAKIQKVRQEVQASPYEAARWGRLGMVLQAHKVAEAEAAYRQAIALEPQPRWHYYLSKVIEAEKPEDALVHAAEAARLEPAYVAARVQKAYLLEQTNQIDEAITELKAALTLDPNAMAVEFALGRVLLTKGDVPGSIEHLQRALAREPNLGSARSLLARAYQRQGDADAARREAEQAKRSPIGVPLFDPWLGEVDAEAVSLLGYLNLARRAEQSGELPHAERLYRHLVEIRPKDADVRFIVGEMYLRFGQPDKARAEYQSALSLQPEHAMAHYRLGQFEESRQNLPAAIEHYRAAVAANPEVEIIRKALESAEARSR
jgi:tetratricopeptide (TPR) repeat protein